VIRGDQGALGLFVRDWSFHCQCGNPGYRLSSLEGFRNLIRAMTSGDQVLPQISRVAGKVRIFGTDSAESERLAEGYTSLTVFGMTTSGVQVLVGICGLGV
jgi:hypothetical protein